MSRGKVALEGGESGAEQREGLFRPSRRGQDPAEGDAGDRGGEVIREVRDFVVVLMSLVYAGMANAMIDQGMNEDSIFRDLQVEFVRRNEAEVTRVLQAGPD